MGKGGTTTQPGDFDLWLLAQSWSPQFCCTNAERCSTVPWAFAARHLSLHGLWPGFSVPRGGETFPSNCAAKAQLVHEAMPREFVDIAPSFATWNAEARRAEVGGLAKHEWKKHGTCSGLRPDGYWNEVLRAFKQLPGDRGTPQLLTNSVGASVDAAALRSAYSRRVAVRADRMCQLSEVTSCFAKQPDGSVGPQVDCPAHVMKGRDSPECATFRITQLGQCMAVAKKKGR